MSDIARGEGVDDVAQIELDEVESPASDATTDDALTAAAAGAVVAAPAKAPSTPAPKKKRTPRWRNPEFDEERESMRAELDQMLAEARDPFFDVYDDNHSVERVEPDSLAQLGRQWKKRGA